MIYVADVASVGIQHEQFNASFIHLLQKENSEQPITFFADATHIEHLQNKIGDTKFEKINIYNQRGGFK